MNRELKFRAWDSTRKIMMDWDDIKYDEFEELNNFFDNVMSDVSPVMQYTGLKDKNGQEIYEGDVVEVHDFNRHKGVIKFGEYEQDGSAGEYGPDNCLGFYVDALGKKQTDEFGLDVIPYFRETHTVLGFDSIEVIGNIYQHPHLLEGESK